MREAGSCRAANAERNIARLSCRFPPRGACSPWIERYIASWARSLVAYMRHAQLEPPPPPQPIPEEVRPYVHDIGT
ncbi:hypothetical protein GCM10010300_15500 [Streptomyces olivaceoviridis]|nr:hypothetical protein GCM10010300_15500 [Streptomyces olivaceoviridis]